MGNVLKSLVDKPLQQAQLYHDNARLEGADDGFHLHYQDFRLLLDAFQFHALARLFDKARTEMETRAVDFNGDDLIASTVISGAGYDNSIKIEECENVYHFHYRGFRFEFSLEGFMEFLYAMKAFVGTFFPNAFLDIELIPLKQINPYDAIHKPSFAEWMDTTTEYAPEHLLQDYARHISVTRDIVQGILSGRQILPILVTSDPNDQTMFIRRDGYCRYMAYKELGFPFIPAHIVTEDVALTQPQHGRGPFLV